LKLAVLGFVYTASAFDLEDYATTYRATRDAYLKAANELKLATGPYKAARDAYVAATATYTKSLYERRRLLETDNLGFDGLEKLAASPDTLFGDGERRELWMWKMYYFPTGTKHGSESARFWEIAGYGGHYQDLVPGMAPEACLQEDQDQNEETLIELLKEDFATPVPNNKAKCSLILQDLRNLFCVQRKFYNLKATEQSLAEFAAGQASGRRLWMWDMDYLCTERGEWDAKAVPGGVADHYETMPGIKNTCTREKVRDAGNDIIVQLKYIFAVQKESPNANCAKERQELQELIHRNSAVSAHRDNLSRGLPRDTEDAERQVKLINLYENEI